MVRSRLCLFALAAGAVGSSGCGHDFAVTPVRARVESQIVRAVDGDTLDVRLPGGITTIRLLAVDSPETYDTRYGSGNECGSHRAAALLDRFVGRRVILVADASQANRDRYGRLLRYVKLPDGRDLGALEVREGLAMPYPYGRPAHRLGVYRRLARSARRKGKGSWSSCRGDFHSAVPGLQNGL